MTGNCRDTIADFADYLDGRVPEIDARVEGHLADCPRCREFLASLQKLPTAVSELFDATVPSDLERRVLARVFGE